MEEFGTIESTIGKSAVPKGPLYDPAQIDAELKRLGVSDADFALMNPKKKKKLMRRVTRNVAPLQNVEMRGGLAMAKIDGPEFLNQKYPFLSTGPYMGHMDQLRAESGHVDAVKHLLKIRPFRLEKPQGSSLHHFMEYDRELERIMDQALQGVAGSPAQMTLGREMYDGLQPFVIEHDWAGAVDIKNLKNPEWVLPFDYTCFEFRIDGCRVLALFKQIEMQITCEMLAVGAKKHWSIANASYRVYGDTVEVQTRVRNVDAMREEYQGLMDFVLKQVLAVSIMLDADVAVRETMRTSGTLNEKRRKLGRAPLRDHHVVRLSRRSRPSPMPDDHVATTGTRRRLHFRRGHWRHFRGEDDVVTSRTWINWCLVGDPDLGFVEKEYRL